MDDTNFLPQDLTECHQLLLAAYKQSVQLEQQVADARRQAERQAAESAQRVEELERVSTKRLPRTKNCNKRTLPHLRNWPGTNVGRSVDGENDFPMSKD